jgi:hypothetical protein
MPANKLQHYVPKAHMRPFTLNAQGKAINMLSIGSRSLIEAAPTRGQCSRPYFYGKDLIIEKGLQQEEGVYAAIVAKAIADATAISVDDLAVLRRATLLQAFRSFGHIEKTIAMADGHYRDLLEMTPAGSDPPEGGPLPHNVAVMMALSHYSETLPVVEDLRAILIVNESRLDFVTSDDPVISVNRY